MHNKLIENLTNL